MDESRINSIIYRIGACLIVSSLFVPLATTVNASKQISKYRSAAQYSYRHQKTFNRELGGCCLFFADTVVEGGGGRWRRGLSGGNLMGKCAVCPR